MSWTSIAADGAWFSIDGFGNDLRWGTTFPFTTRRSENRIISGLSLEWLLAPATLDAIIDVPGDQGGEARLRFTRSGYDFLDEPNHPVVGHQIYRRVEDLRSRDFAKAPAGSKIQANKGKPSIFLNDDMDLRCKGNQWYIVGRGPGRDEFPPGIWEIVSTMFATQQEEYLVLVPTLGDSTASGIQWTTFLVSTHTTIPDIWFISESDSGYSVDNLAPSPPDNLHWESSTMLVWEECPDEDFNYFTVYGSEVEVLDETAVVIGYSIDPGMDVGGTTFSFYHVTATDFHDNEGEAANIPSSFSVVIEPPIPSTFDFRVVNSNPLRQSATFLFDLPTAVMVKLRVFGISGRLVSMVRDQAYGPGSYRVIWKSDDASCGVRRSGIYYARLEAGNYTGVQRLLLVE